MDKGSKFPELRTEGDTIRSSKALGASNFGPHLSHLSKQARITLSQSRRTQCEVRPAHPWSPGPADTYRRTHG